jgi:hypothetical protein
VDARVLSAFPGNGHYRRAGNTWSHVLRAGTSSEKLVIDPNPGAPAVGAGVPQRVFDITISTKAEVLEALRCACSSLRRAARDARAGAESTIGPDDLARLSPGVNP